MTSRRARVWTGTALVVLALALPTIPFAAGPGLGFGDSGMVDEGGDTILPLPNGDILLSSSSETHAYVQRLAEDGAKKSTTRLFACKTDCARVQLALDRGRRVLVAAGRRVARLMLSGVFDRSFGVRGVASAPFRILGLAAAPDGAVIVTTPGRLARLRPDGTLDPSFGVVTLPAAFQFPRPIVQGDGKIVVGGANSSAPPWVVRYTAAGDLDAAFGEAAAAAGPLRLGALTPLADGKVLVAGVLEVGSPWGARVIRLLGDGTPDPLFGTAGVSVAWPPIGGMGDFIGALAVQPSGRIVVGGTSVYGKQSYWFVNRLGADGRSARNSVSFGGEAQPERDCWGGAFDALAVQRDGKILTSGYGCEYGGLVRLLPDLSSDDADTGLGIRRVPNWIRPAKLQRRGAAWVASLRIEIDYPSELTVTVTVRKGRWRLPLLAGSTAGKTVLRRTARRVTATRSSAGALGIRVLVPARAVRAGGEYSFVVEAADRRDRTAELWVTLVTR